MEDTSPTRLIQKRFLAGGQEIEIIGTDKIVVRSWGRKGRNEFNFSPAELDPNPSVHHKLSIRNLVGGIILALCAVVFLAVCIWFHFFEAHPFSDPTFTWPLVLCSLISFFAFREYQNLSVDVTTFYTAGGGRIPVWRTIPDVETSRKFVAHMKELITHARESAQSAYTQSIANEIRGLSKLRDDGILSEQEYKKAKARLLGFNDENRLDGPAEQVWN